jgi:hypothetical protein
LKEVEKTSKAMPHLSVSMSKPFFLEVAQNGIDKGANYQIIGRKIDYTSKQKS